MRAWASLAALLLGVGAAAGAEERAQTRWQANLLLENDLFNDGEDDDYTNGVMISFTSPEPAEDGAFIRFARLLELFDDDNEDVDVRTEIAFSQAMFTPTDLSLTAPDPHDRPYAGLALLSLGLIAAADGSGQARGRRFDQVVFVMGAIGPVTGADDAQIAVHDYLRAPAPQGWSTQIPNRALAGLSYQTTRRLGRLGEDDDAALFWHAGATLGNIQTDLSLGATARIGHNAPVTFGLPRIAPSLPGSGYFVTNHNAGWFGFLGVQARYVAYDVTLDERHASGETFIDRYDLVGDIQAGLVGYIGAFRLSYTHVWRTDQFRDQQSGDGFGSVALGFALPF